MHPTLRRAPSQQRSRERVDKILDAARDLIAQNGSDALHVAEVAQRAGVSIGSLYQYFPDRSAIIRTLAERYNAIGRACIAEKLAGVRTAAGLRRAFAELLDTYYALFWEEPVMRDIWAGMQSDKALRAVELTESRANAALLSAAMARVWPDEDRAQLESAALLIMQLGEAAMRLAITVGRTEGDALIEHFKEMADGVFSRRKSRREPRDTR